MSFNPTASVVNYNGDNGDVVRDFINRNGGTFNGSLTKGMHYVIFLGNVVEMTDAQLHAAMGRV